MFHRITGVVLAGPLYLFMIGYVISPYAGWHLESTVLATSFADLSTATKVFLKTLVAWPFTFHCINGVRHLTWDTGALFSKQAVIRSGWAAVVLSGLSALYLAVGY